MNVWITVEGAYYTERPGVESVRATKQLALDSNKAAGFKYDKRQGLYLNEETRMYRKLFKMPVLGAKR